MTHDKDNTATQEGLQGIPIPQDQEGEAEALLQPDDAAPEDDTDSFYEQMINENLKTLRGQFRRLKEAIEAHIEDIERGEVADKGVSDIVKRIDPLLNTSMLQETRIHEKLAQRLGKAGRHAVDLGSARTEIGRRLARLRDAAGDA